MRDLAYSTTAQQRICCSIKKTGACLMLTSLLSGCWAPSIKPSDSKLDHLQTVLIVPVESPPLEIIPDLLEQHDPAYRHYHEMSLGFSLPTKLYQTAGGLVVAGLVSEDQKTDAIIVDALSSFADASAKTEPDWTPAKAVALQTQNLLTVKHLKGVLSREGYRLPLTDAARTAELHHWHDAIQTWYGLEQTPVDYSRSGNFDAAMELGIGSYRIFEGQISLQILIKLIDPATRQVIARTRVDNYRVDDAALASVDRDGEQFKQLIANMSISMLRQGLGDIGLHSSTQWTD